MSIWSPTYKQSACKHGHSRPITNIYQSFYRAMLSHGPVSVSDRTKFDPPPHKIHTLQPITKNLSQVITCDKFLVMGWRVWILWGGSNLIPLTKPVAVNTALTSSATAEGPREHAMPMISCHLLLNTVLFRYLAVLGPRVGHTMDVLSPFIPIRCHSDWLFHGESCLRLDNNNKNKQLCIAP